MNSRILLAAIIVLIVAIAPSLGIDDGKYRPNQIAKKGQYVHEEHGKYVENPSKWRYVHVNDQREKGKYIHVHIPYDGGYGPYSHLDNPYLHEDNPYIHDIEPKGEYSHLDPFRTDVFYIEKPQIYQEYGFPNHDPFATKYNDKGSQISDNVLLPIHKSSSTESLLFSSSTESSSRIKPTSIQDKILGASTNSRGQPDPFGSNVFDINKPLSPQEYGFPNHVATKPKEPQENIIPIARPKTTLGQLELDLRFTGSSSSLGSTSLESASSSLGSLVTGKNINQHKTSGTRDELPDIFKKNFFDVDKPEIPLEYGFPDHSHSSRIAKELVDESEEVESSSTSVTTRIAKEPKDESEEVESSSPSATEIIFVSSTGRSPKRNVEIIHEDDPEENLKEKPEEV